MLLGEAMAAPPESTPTGGWGGVAMALGRASVGKVTFRTQFSPPIEVDPFAPSPPSATPNPLLLLLRPEVEIRAPDGSLVAAIAPYGSPAANYFPWLVLGSVVLAVGFWHALKALAGAGR